MPVLVGFIITAIQAVLVWLFQQVVVKFVVLAALYVVVMALVPILVSLLPTGDGGIASLFAQMPSGIWYFIDVFRLDVGVAAILSASVTRFMIRRLPVIG